MRIKNIRNYRDKETGENQKSGEYRSVSSKRGREIIEKGAAVKAEEEPAPEAEE